MEMFFEAIMAPALSLIFGSVVIVGMAIWLAVRARRLGPRRRREEREEEESEE